VGAELFDADGQTNGRAGTQKYMIQLIVAFRHFTKAPQMSRCLCRYSAVVSKDLREINLQNNELMSVTHVIILCALQYSVILKMSY
jgi:hypothetical protein